MNSPSLEPQLTSSAILDNRAYKWIALIGLMWVAAFLRLHRLDQLPPVVSYDEAYNGVEAQRILRLDYRPIFFEANGGRMPLFIYLIVGPIALFGSQAWSLRLIPATWGLVAIPLIYQMGRELFRHTSESGQTVGALAAACVAVLLWHVQPSRIGIPSVQLIPVSLLAIWFFWRGWYGKGYKSFFFSGLTLGVTLYAHLAGRIAPFVIAGFVTMEVLANCRGRKLSRSRLLHDRRTIGCALTGLGTLLVFAPMAAYFLAHPGALTLRSQDIYILGPVGQRIGPPLKVLADNAVLVLRMFIDRGDVNIWYNLPGRPALDPLMQAGFLVGVIMALTQLRQPQYRLLLLWLGGMLMPSVLSIEAPHFTRTVGAIVPVSMMIGIGLNWLWAQSARLLRFRSTTSWPIVLMAIAVVSGGLTYDAYFNRWSKLLARGPGYQAADNEQWYREAEYAIAQRALELSQTGDVALPLEVFIRPSGRFLLETTFSKVAPLSDWSADRPVALLASARLSGDALVVLHRTSAGSGLAYISETLPEAAVQQFQQEPDNGLIHDATGHIAARIIFGVEKQIAALRKPRQTVQASFDNVIRLAGYSLQLTPARAGHPLHLTLYWESVQPTRQNYTVFVHLVDAAGNIALQLDNPSLRGTYPTSLWSPGEIIPDPYDFTLPADMAVGKYRFEIGLYNQLDGNSRLPVVAIGDQPVEDNRILIGVITIPDTTRGRNNPQNVLEATVGQPPLIRLQGYDLAKTVVAPGEPLDLVLYWQALHTMDRDYTIFVHLQDAAGQILAQQDIQPQAGRAPTTLWESGETVIDRHKIDLGPDIPPGRYSLSVGLYYWATGERLPIADSQRHRLEDDRLPLPVTIEVTQRGTQ